MEKFDKTNPYNPNATKSNNVNLSKPKLPKWAKITLIWIASSIALVFIIAIISLINETPQEKKAREELAVQNEKKEQEEAEVEIIRNLPKCTPVQALVMSRTFVEEQLISPASAEFSDDLSGVEQINDTVFKINSSLDSQNKMGVMLRSKYSCKIIYHPKDATYTVNGLILQ